jgi:osmotically-inducible protein OsmY
VDWNDPSQYDLVINRNKISPELAAKLIVDAALSDEMKACSLTALESMEKLSLTRKIEAAVLKGNLGRDSIHVEVLQKGVAHISGFTYAEQYKDQLLKIVKGVPGVSDVKFDVAVLPAGLA